MALEYWTAKEAAARLGVSVPTLYAYVSRGRIGSVAMPGSKEHRYLRSDVEGFRAARGQSLRAGAGTAVESAITLITADGPVYRGRPAVEMAASAGLEEVAALLWETTPAVFDQPPLRGGRLVTRLARSLRDQPASLRTAALFPFLETMAPQAYDLSPAGVRRTGATILRWLAAIVLGRPEARPDRIHEQFATVLQLSPELADILRRLLVLAADHGSEQATDVVRAVAATGVTPWRSVAAGVSVVTGRSSKFGRNDALRRLLGEILNGPDGGRPILDRLHDNEELPGFDSAIYPDGDPRARALLDHCGAALSGDRDMRLLRDALRVAGDARGARPNFALASMFAEAKLGLASRGSPSSLSSTEAPFLVARAAGWIAHGMEQYATGEAVRRHLAYKGALPSPRFARDQGA